MIKIFPGQVSWLRSSLDEERGEKERLQQEWSRKQEDLNVLISELEEQVAAKNLQLLPPKQVTF